MTASTTAPQTVKTAQEAVIAARDAHEDLRNRAKTGDMKVTAAAVAEAADAIVLSELRLEAAIATKAAAERAAVEADVEAVRAAIIVTGSDGLAELRATYAKAVRALEVLAADVAAYEAKITKLRGAGLSRGLSDVVGAYLPQWRQGAHDYLQLAADEAHGRPSRFAHPLAATP